jgi:hypothetical protein
MTTSSGQRVMDRPLDQFGGLCAEIADGAAITEITRWAEKRTKRVSVDCHEIKTTC